MYVLCYDKKMKLVDEIGPFKTDEEAFKRMHKEALKPKYRHVEVAEKVDIK